MSLRNGNRRKKDFHNLQSLQEQKICKKTLSDSLRYPKAHRRQAVTGEASCPALLLRAEKGSITVEAALVFPLFLFAMANLLTLFFMFRRYGETLAQLHQKGRELSLFAYGSNEADEQDIRLIRVNQVKPLTGFMGYPGCIVVNGCVMHKWIGYDVQGDTSAGRETTEMVYVTREGEAYHSSRSCSYLNVSLRTVSYTQAQGMKNENGERYRPCEICSKEGETVYITEYGNRYHTSVACHGLKRTIDWVSLTEALERGRHACPRCVE